MNQAEADKTAATVALECGWEGLLQNQRELERALNALAEQLIIASAANAEADVELIYRNISIVKDYRCHIESLANRLLHEQFAFNSLVVAPIQKLNTDGMVIDGLYSSSDAASYEVATNLESRGIKVEKKRVGNPKFTTGKVVVFVDDFLGTGSQVVRYFETLGQAFFQKNECYLLSVAAMETAIKTLEPWCAIHVGTVFSKCFDMFATREASTLRARYGCFASNVQISADYRFGFKGSEALVVMKRTPNNSLETIWANKRIGGKKWPSLFPR